MLGRNIGRILEPLVRGGDIHDTLILLCKIIEEDLAGRNLCAAIITLDRRNGCIGVAAGPAMNRDHVAAIKRLPLPELTDKSDVAALPLRPDYRELAMHYGLPGHDCQSITSHDGAVLGVLVLHAPKKHTLTLKQRQNTEQVTQVAAIAIQRAESEREKESQATAMATMVNNVNQGIAIFDSNLRLANWNHLYEALYCFPDNILQPGTPYADIIRHLAERGEYGDVDLETFVAKRLAELETTTEWRNLRHCDNGTSIAIYRRRLPDGGIICTFTDISAEVRATFETQRNAKLLATTLDNVKIGIRVIDQNGRLALWNQHYQAMFDLPDRLIRQGTPYEDLLRFANSQIFSDPEKLRERIELRLRQWADGKRISEIREWQNGKVVHQTSEPMPDGGIVTTYADITHIHRTEKALETKTTLLQTSLENINQGLLLFDANMKLELVNRAYLNLFHIVEDEIQPGMSYTKILQKHIDRGEYAKYGDAGEIIDERIASARDGKIHHNLHRSPDGTVISIYRKPVSTGGFAITFTDITEEVRAGEDAKVKSELLQITQDNMAQAICQLDADLRVRNFNANWAKMLDLPPEIARAGISIADVLRYRAKRGDLGEGDMDKLVEHRIKTMHNGEALRSERVLPSGQVITILRTPIPGGGFVITYTDVTERWIAEREAEKKSALLETALANMSQGIAIHDAEQRLVTCNDKYTAWRGGLPTKLLEPGPPHEETIRYRAQNGNYGPGDPLGQLRNRMDKMQAGEIRSAMRLIDGHVIRAQREIMPGGGFVTTYTDITDLKKIETELIRAKEFAEMGSRAKTEFLANMSHELRTPLNAIIGFSEMIQSGIYGPLGDGRYDDYISSINESGLHLLSLIDDILDLSKIEVGRIELSESEVDLTEVVESCLMLVREQSQAAKIDLRSANSRGIPPIHADSRRLKQVLLNLLQNAIKFTPEGGTIRAETELMPDGSLQISIADTGIGMKAEDIPRALERFGQIDSSLSRRFDGAGLGLPLSKALMELHGGTLEIKSAPGEGTIVLVTLPRERLIPRQNGAEPVKKKVPPRKSA